MILQSLAEFALRESLVEDRNFEYAGVTWAIELSADGEFLELFDLRTESSGKKKKLLARQMTIPKRSKRTGQDQPEFLVDKAEYVLGLGDADEERRKRRRVLFAGEIESAAKATDHPGALALSRFLTNETAMGLCTAEIEKCGFASNDLLCFRVEGDYLHQAEPLKQYWRQSSANSGNGQCLVCGKRGSIARLHPNIKGLAGASTSGVPIVSFNASAFWSYGWENNANAPVCDDCAAGYTTALNRCLSQHFPDPHDPEVKLPRQAYTLGENLTAVYWSDDPASGVERQVDAAANDPAMAKALFESATRGGGITSKPLRFHCLLLQGAQGRASVRSYIAETIPQVQQNLRDWTAQTEVGTERPLALFQILSGLSVQREARRLPSTLSGELYLAILFGRPIPLNALQLAVARNRAESKVTPARAALLQAWRNRKPKLNERKPFVSLDTEYPSVGYQLGRLLAICESIQHRKAGASPNKTVADRYFSALSTRPLYVFKSLMQLTELHLAQLRRRGMANYFRKKIADVLARLSPGEMPHQLSLEEQANFALGFYHQRQDNFKKSPAQDNGENAPEHTESEQQPKEQDNA